MIEVQVVTKEILANLRDELKSVLGKSIKVTSSRVSNSTLIQVQGNKSQQWRLTDIQKDSFHSWAEQNNALNFDATEYDRNMPCNHLCGDIGFMLKA